MPAGIPVIVTVLAALSVAKFKPAGTLKRLIPVAEPPHLNVIGSIASPLQTICCPKGAVVCTSVGWALISI